MPEIIINPKGISVNSTPVMVKIFAKKASATGVEDAAAGAREKPREKPSDFRKSVDKLYSDLETFRLEQKEFSAAKVIEFLMSAEFGLPFWAIKGYPDAFKSASWQPCWGRKGMSQRNALTNFGFVIGFELVDNVTDKKFAQIRIDWDENKKFHINLEVYLPGDDEKLNLAFVPVLTASECAEAVKHCAVQYPEWTIAEEQKDMPLEHRLGQMCKIYWWDKLTGAELRDRCRMSMPEDIVDFMKQSVARVESPAAGSHLVRHLATGVEKAASAPTTPKTPTATRCSFWSPAEPMSQVGAADTVSPTIEPRRVLLRLARQASRINSPFSADSLTSSPTPSSTPTTPMSRSAISTPSSLASLSVLSSRSSPLSPVTSTPSPKSVQSAPQTPTQTQAPTPMPRPSGRR